MKLKCLSLLSLLLATLSLFGMEQADTLGEDEITFINARQGACTLINKFGSKFYPILCDAGSMSKELSREYGYQTLEDEIVAAVLEAWQTKEERGLNIIISHPEKDHCGLVPKVIRRLKKGLSKEEAATFECNILCGGGLHQYSNEFLATVFQVRSDGDPGIRVYSAEYEKNKFLFTRNNLRNLNFLRKSGCVSHVYVPGVKAHTNDESIITRIQLNNVSAIIAGDVDRGTKKDMCDAMKALNIPLSELRADILLIPHHGGYSQIFHDWEPLIDPRVLVVGAGQNDGYKHPSGPVLAYFLQQFSKGKNERRIWSTKADKYHMIQFYSNNFVKNIEKYIQDHNMLFEKVDSGAPNLIRAWTDVSLYTLYSSGSMKFKSDISSPEYLQAPLAATSYMIFSPKLKNLLTYTKLFHFLSFNGFTQEDVGTFFLETYSDWAQLANLIEFMNKELKIKEQDIAGEYKEKLLELRQKDNSFEGIALELIKNYSEKERKALQTKLKKYFKN